MADMKLDRTKTAVIIAVLVVFVTIDAWRQVKETGRRASIAAQAEAALRDGGAEAD